MEVASLRIRFVTMKWSSAEEDVCVVFVEVRACNFICMSQCRHVAKYKCRDNES